MKISSRLEGDLGEVSVEDLFDTIRKKCKFLENGVVLRMASDQEYWDLVVGINRQIQRAQNGGALIGGTIKVWTQNGLYAEGTGWRVVIVPQEFKVDVAGPTAPRLMK